MNQLLLLLSCLLLLSAIQGFRGWIGAIRQIRQLSVDTLDSDGRLLTVNGIFHRMIPEIRRAISEGACTSLVLFTYHGSDLRSAAIRLAPVLRRHETAYELVPNEILVALRGLDKETTILAVSRLGQHMLNGESRVIDAGVIIITPENGMGEIDDLVIELRKRSRPIQEFIDWGKLNRDAVLERMQNQAPISASTS